MIHVTRDHLDGVAMDERIVDAPLYGLERLMGIDPALPTDGLPTVRFKLFDDDGELYYSGVLSDDDECENQIAALRWGETMAGCAIVKVKRDGEYVQEIG